MPSSPLRSVCITRIWNNLVAPIPATVSVGPEPFTLMLAVEYTLFQGLITTGCIESRSELT